MYVNTKKKYININLKSNFRSLTVTSNSLTIRRSNSTSSSLSSSVYTPLPVTIKVFYKLDKDSILTYRNLLKDKGGVYCFINTINNKQYIGSAKDLHLRLIEHLANKKSNIALQSAIEKYGLDKFNFGIYEYYSYDNKIVSSKALTDIETSYIEKFNFDTLYNFMRTATSLAGYKHTEEAKLKMLNWYKNKHNHPMYGKTHKEETLQLISKPGKLNPMYGKSHSEQTKANMSERMNKYTLGVGLRNYSSLIREGERLLYIFSF